MRRDKSKLVRLLRHLSFKDLASLSSINTPSSSATNLLIQGTAIVGSNGHGDGKGFLDLSSLASSSGEASHQGMNVRGDHSSSDEISSHQLASQDQVPQPSSSSTFILKRKKICIEFLKNWDELGVLAEEAFSDDYVDSISLNRSVVSKLPLAIKSSLTLFSSEKGSIDESNERTRVHKVLQL